VVEAATRSFLRWLSGFAQSATELSAAQGTAVRGAGTVSGRYCCEPVQPGGKFANASLQLALNAERTAPRGPVGTNRGQSVFGRGRQSQEFLHDPLKQLGSVDDPQFAVKPADVGVDSMDRKVQVKGNGGFFLIVEYTMYDLKLTTG